MKESKFIGKKHYQKKNNENDDESETETLDIGVPQEKMYGSKILLKTSIETSSKKQKIANIRKQKDESIYIKEDMFVPTKNKDILEEIKELRRDITEIKKDKEKSERENKELRRDITEIKKDKEKSERENKELRKDIKRDKENFEREKKKLRGYNRKLEEDLEKFKGDSKNNYSKILNELDLLKNQVKELEEFHFSSKLRKLLKNLIGFIIHNFYPQYMLYQESIDRIYFVNAPRFPYNLEWAEDIQIIDALNRILELLFSTAKDKDFVIHFVDPRAKKNNHYKRIYNVFSKPDDFFRFFNISYIDRKILIELIPENYFTQIDNISFEINLKELMSKISNEKNIFNNKKK